MATVMPVPRVLYVCERVERDAKGKISLLRLFDSLTPENGYPYTMSSFCVFCQLTNGLKQVEFYLQVRHCDEEVNAHRTFTQILSFPNRTTVEQVAMTIRGYVFPRPGVYFVELFCDNVFVCDTRLRLLGTGDK